MTKSDAIKKIEELQAYIECLDAKQNWEPGEDETYYFVDFDGFVDSQHNYGENDDKWNIKTGNCFKTEQEAENYKMRLIAMKPKYLPKEGEEYWTLVNPGTRSLTWDNDFTDKTRYYSGMTFKTKQEAQEWLDTYGKYFEVEAND